jgi:hypothetical protein
MSVEIRSDEVDVEKLMREIRARIAEKRGRLYTEDEVREIVEHRLEAPVEGRDLGPALLAELRSDPARWNYRFDADTVYRSSRGTVGSALETIRRVLRPVQKLFWNPNPMISALSRQSDLNASYVHLLHNLTLELTRLNLEVAELKHRVLQLQGRLEFQARREKTLEDMVAADLPRRRSESGAAHRTGDAPHPQTPGSSREPGGA